MLSNLNYLLVTTTCFVSICTAIRVDFNTNTGPIIPPTPRTTVRPVPPFREPAPVWEDQSNDIPNPNPFIYVPPPPSRPKQRLHTNINFNYNDNNNIKYGSIVTPNNANGYYQPNYNYNNNNSHKVASLAPQYIPGVGTKYVAVVPATNTLAKPLAANNKYAQTSVSNAISPVGKTQYKLHGKYNDKTKKYKAYEKVKYVPVHYNYQSTPSTVNTTIQFDKQLNEQGLPAVNIEQQWFSPFITINSTPTTSINQNESLLPKRSYTKHVYAKDATNKKKEKLNDSLVKAKKS